VKADENRIESSNRLRAAKHKRKYYPRKRSGKRRGIIRNKISATKGKKLASKSIKSSKKTLRK
jgi:hypothetical protein